MSPLADASLVFHPATDTANNFLAIDSADLHIWSEQIEIEGTPLTGLALRVNVSTGTGTSPHLTVELWGTTTTTAPTSARVVTDAGMRMLVSQTFLELATASGEYVEYILPFCDPEIRALKAVVELTGTTATAALTLASVEVAIVQNVGTNWSRAVNFH
ncbi:hypothetical protein CCP3SC15_910004 [Gammaproteobacteria bacterium]